MAINFSAYRNQKEAVETTESVRVPFFKLEPNESTDVVINFDPDTVKVHKIHEYKIDGKLSKVKCIKEPRTAESNAVYCPLCDKAFELYKQEDKKNPFYKFSRDKVFLHLFDTEGNPFQWERSATFVEENIMPLIDTYGNISELVVTIKRTGSGLDTKYAITPKLIKTDSGFNIVKPSEAVVKGIKEAEFPDPEKTFIFVGDDERLREFLRTGILYGEISAEKAQEQLAKEQLAKEKEADVPVLDDEDIPF